MVQTLPRLPALGAEIPLHLDPRLVNSRALRLRRLAQLTPAQRSALILERNPVLTAFPRLEWERLSITSAFAVLYGASSRHGAQVELAVMHGILASAGCSKGYLDHADMCIRNVLNNVHQTFEIATARRIRSRWTFGKLGDATRT